MDIYLRKMLKDTQRDSEYVGMDFAKPLNGAGISQGYGVSSRGVERPEDLRPALREALDSGGPSLVDVVIDGSL